MKEHLQSSLDNEMQGIQRMPALFFNNPFPSQETSRTLRNMKFLLMNLYMIFQTTLKMLLETFCTIQEILYLPEESRKEQQILQLILALFNHAMIMKIHMDGHIKSTSEIFMAYNLTSNHRPSKVIYNTLVCIEAHQILTANKKDREKNDERFAKLYQSIKKNLSNTIISFKQIRNYYGYYQALLEQIDEYLICDTKCCKENSDGYSFLG